MLRSTETIPRKPHLIVCLAMSRMLRQRRPAWRPHYERPTARYLSERASPIIGPCGVAGTYDAHASTAQPHESLTAYKEYGAGHERQGAPDRR